MKLWVKRGCLVCTWIAAFGLLAALFISGRFLVQHLTEHPEKMRLTQEAPPAGSPARPGRPGTPRRQRPRRGGVGPRRRLDARSGGRADRSRRPCGRVPRGAHPHLPGVAHAHAVLAHADQSLGVVGVHPGFDFCDDRVHVLIAVGVHDQLAVR